MMIQISFSFIRWIDEFNRQQQKTDVMRYSVLNGMKCDENQRHI